MPIISVPWRMRHAVSLHYMVNSNPPSKTLSQNKIQAGSMVLWVDLLDAKPYELSSVPRT